MTTVAISGASGFLGRHLCKHFVERGWRVRALLRDPGRFPSRRPEIGLYACDLPDRIDESALVGADAMIHCAYSTRPSSCAEARRVNELGTRRVYEASRRSRVGKFVFLSSTSAHEQALSYYGRSKLDLERAIDLGRDLVFRAGLIIGPGEGSLFHRMVDSLRRTGLVPVFDGGRQILQTIYVADLCQGIERAIVSSFSGRYVVAEREGLPLREFFRLVAERLGIRCRFVSLPAAPTLLALRILERIGASLPISSENVLGVKSLRFQSSAADLAALSIHARPAAESLGLVLDTGR